MVRFNFYLCCFILLLFSACAQIVPPTGGAKDVTPPKPLSYSPENKSLHFNSNKILIKFNEYIQLKDISNQLIVSPPLKHFPVVRVKGGRELELILKDTLQENTTYTFNFGNSISDLNEGNVLPGFHYVFSTGTYLDSLIVSGQLNDAFTLEAPKDGIVMLYADQSDSAPYKKLPSYYTRVDANGKYSIENIKPATYKIIALSKSQGDYFYHPYGEEIGFSSTPLNIIKNDTVNLSLFTEVEPKLHLLKTKALEKGKIQLVFNRSADSLTFKLLNLPPGSAKPYTYIQYSVTGDTVNYWINIPGLDSLRFIVSRNTKAVDTSVVYSFPGQAQNKKNAKPVPLKMSLSAHDKQADFDYHNPIILQCEHPLAKYILTKIHLTQGKDTIHFTTDTTRMPLGIAINTAFKSDSSYHLFIPPGTFTDIFGLTNDTINIHFKIDEPTHFGSLKLALKISKTGSTYLLQLLDGQNNVYKQNIVKQNQTIMYNALLPGNYRIRAIEDADGNGKWTPGNFIKGIQPEKVFYDAQTITIRSSWEVTENWPIK